MFKTDKKRLMQIHEQIQARRRYHMQLRDRIRDDLNHMEGSTSNQRASKLRWLTQQVLILNELNLILGYFEDDSR